MSASSRPHVERSLPKTLALPSQTGVIPPPALTPQRSPSPSLVGKSKGLYNIQTNHSTASLQSRHSVLSVREQIAWDTISMHESVADPMNPPPAHQMLTGERSAPSPQPDDVNSGGSSISGGSLAAESNRAMSLFLMSQYLFQRLQRKGLIPNSRVLQDYSSCGLLVRRGPGSYLSQPMSISPSLLNAVSNLDVCVAFTMKSYITEPIFKALRPDQTELELKRGGDRYQVVDSLEEIAQASPKDISRFQYICFVREERVVLLWHDSIREIVEHATKVEEVFLSQILNIQITTPYSDDVFSTKTDKVFGNLYVEPEMTLEKIAFYKALQGDDDEKAAPASDLGKISPYDVERGTLHGESLSRKVLPYTSLYVGIAMAAVVVLVLAQLVRTLLMEVVADSNYVRLALIAAIPLLLPLTWFFADAFIIYLAQIIGPVGGLRENSRYYSAKPPDVKRAMAVGFKPPHITIQMPVYKESLNVVIKPTVDSLKAAITQYELQGGTASIFINDDGLQALPTEEARKRIEYYRNNNIGWVARPRNGHDGFVRGGKFKKASNMNFALQLSVATEEKLIDLVRERFGDRAVVSGREEQELYSEAMKMAIKENGWAWAGGNIRVGEFLLIVDSDTRVPKNCLMYSAAEMYLNPEVGILQHSSNVMNVTQSFFENGIAFFTDLVYYAIRFCCGSGEPAPFVGHNAFIRWQALQSVVFQDRDGLNKWWSESHVSEDFDLSFRLQATGNITRLAAYHIGDDAFQEGVSLTVYDELSRWKKYTYGSTELIFNPFIQWPTKGPFARGFKQYLNSKQIFLSSKIHVTAYLFSYHAMASALPLTILNYILVGWLYGQFDQFFIQSWQTFMAVIFVFNGVGNVSLAVLRYRLSEQGFFYSLLQNLKWAPFLIVFFGGLSFHLNTIILSYLFSIPVQDWTGTQKEAENSNFFRESSKIIRSFKWMYLFMFILIGGMIYLGTAAPHGWLITDHAAIVPLAFNIACHCLLPLVLNPDLTKVNF
ncbi:hypothetical protein ABW19_dt0208813 [Dactylella cylindrospora]|nr:hypothetical protein ABW19_dt0208813 [Dactylella cylindrospora]